MDKNYWENYYNKNKAVDFPSPFAKYCVSQGFIKDSVVIDIGCGNGRDSFYFIENSARKVFGIDQSEVAILKNNKKIVNLEKSFHNKINFFAGNFVNYKNYLGLKLNFFYSRFTLHAINSDEQLKFISMLSEIMNSGDICAIEARTTNDSTFDEGIRVTENINFTDHHRCFLNPSEIIKTIIHYEFEITYFEESDDFAVFNEEKPSVMRIIFKRL